MILPQFPLIYVYTPLARQGFPRAPERPKATRGKTWGTKSVRLEHAVVKNRVNEVRHRRKKEHEIDGYEPALNDVGRKIAHAAHGTQNQKHGQSGHERLD